MGRGKGREVGRTRSAYVDACCTARRQQLVNCWLSRQLAPKLSVLEASFDPDKLALILGGAA